MAKKKGKDKAPKRVAGVKVPKAVRGGLVASFLDDPRTREILADVLMAAAGAAAAALVKHRPSGREVADAGAAAAGATRDVAQDAAALITDTVTEAARHILPGGEGVTDSRRLLLYFRRDHTGRLVMGGRSPVDDLPAKSDAVALQETWKLYTSSVTGGGSLLNLSPVPVPPAEPAAGAASPVPETAKPGEKPPTPKP